MNSKEKSDIARKLKVLNHALISKNVSKTCRYFGISRETYYQWKRAYDKHGELALINSKPWVLSQLSKKHHKILDDEVCRHN